MHIKIPTSPMIISRSIFFQRITPSVATHGTGPQIDHAALQRDCNQICLRDLQFCINGNFHPYECENIRNNCVPECIRDHTAWGKRDLEEKKEEKKVAKVNNKFR